MCGRYVLTSRPESLEQALERSNIKCTKFIDKEKYQSSYNVAPCHFQPVVRVEYDSRETILHTMKWGLIPSWTKGKPEFSKLIINCRDDSLKDGKSMFNSMKNRKRCVVVADGFYEWLKKDKKRIPYFIKRKDGNLFLFAGLYDCVKFEDEENPLYTYTIITTMSSAPIEFLHDRMPVILENGSEELATWLDPRTPWSPELVRLLKPFAGELEIYPVSDDVGHVKNNSPDLIIPLDSKKSVIDFFQKKQEIRDDVDATTKMEQNEDGDQIKKDDDKVVPAKRSLDTSDDETTSDTKSNKVQKDEFDIPSSPDPKKESLPSTPPSIPKKSLRSTPSKSNKTPKRSLQSTPSKRQPPRKKKVDNVKESEKITNYFSTKS
ncbi:10349_t:CDS:2 [Funneliformis caledonium]|uniref:10349_t:CDS:1 n=2 Tax=Funneliformis TaxID=1117308 RepID=A0A9N8VNK1_9GLOM|nr:10349_t:CDS:2 [Funneliformis caledonium]CAG8581929.1 4995_t:CDS:2 [Funneliformis mosseae]